MKSLGSHRSVPGPVTRQGWPRASEENQVREALRAAQRVDLPGRPVREPTWELESFGLSWLGVARVRVHAGSLNVHGEDCYDAATTDLTLQGATCYAYLEREPNTPVVTIKVSEERPKTAGGTFRRALYEFAGVAGVYHLVRDRRHDIDLGAPKRI